MPMALRGHQSQEPVSIALQDTQCLLRTAGCNNVSLFISSLGTWVLPAQSSSTRILEGVSAVCLTSSRKCRKCPKSARKGCTPPECICWVPWSHGVNLLTNPKLQQCCWHCLVAGSRKALKCSVSLDLTHVAPHWVPKSVTNLYFSAVLDLFWQLWQNVWHIIWY